MSEAESSNGTVESGSGVPVNPGVIRIGFGKHKGQRIERVPIDYLKWILRESKPRPKLKACIEAYLVSEEGRERAKAEESASGMLSGGYGSPGEVVARFPLPRGNYIEIRLAEGLLPDDIPIFDRIVELFKDSATRQAD